MSVNWFEGGRRISMLFITLVTLGGAAYVVFVNEPMPTLSIRGPTMPWFVSDEDCKASSYRRYLWNYDWGGNEEGLVLCYLDIDGDIPYSVAPTPPEEIRRQQAEKAEDRARIARGEPPVLRLNMPWFYTANEFDARVQSWVDRSAAELRVTPELRKRLLETRSAARWQAHRKAFSDAAPWVVGLSLFIWLFTAAMGWIVRGFAGVPTGEDFRRKTS